MTSIVKWYRTLFYHNLWFPDAIRFKCNFRSLMTAWASGVVLFVNAVAFNLFVGAETDHVEGSPLAIGILEIVGPAAVPFGVSLELAHALPGLHVPADGPPQGRCRVASVTLEDSSAPFIRGVILQRVVNGVGLEAVGVIAILGGASASIHWIPAPVCVPVHSLIDTVAKLEIGVVWHVRDIALRAPANAVREELGGLISDDLPIRTSGISVSECCSCCNREDSLHLNFINVLVISISFKHYFPNW